MEFGRLIRYKKRRKKPHFMKKFERFTIFLKELKNKFTFPRLKRSISGFFEKVKDLSISNDKVSKLQREIEEFELNKAEARSGEKKQEYLFLSSDLKELSADIEHMIVAIHNKEQKSWETIETTLPVHNSKLQTSHDSLKKRNYWKTSFRTIFLHYSEKEDKDLLLKYDLTPYSFKYPLLNRLVYKMKHLELGTKE